MAIRDCCVAGAGISCLDYVIVAPRVKWGETAEITHYAEQGGGLVATALVACARLGARTCLYSLLGEDALGSRIVSDLREEGVDVSGVALIPGGASPFSFVHLEQEGGERTIFHRSGIGLSWPGGRGWEGLEGCDALLVDGCYPDLAREAASAARARGVPVVADIIPEPGNLDLVRLVDVVITPREYARKAGFENNMRSALDKIHDMGPKTAVITLGAGGWLASDPSGLTRGDAFRVKAADTLGAGDVFHGAYAFGLAQGWETARCCEFASASAALKCMQLGSRAGIPDLASVMAFLQQHGRFGDMDAAG